MIRRGPVGDMQQAFHLVKCHCHLVTCRRGLYTDSQVFLVLRRRAAFRDYPVDSDLSRPGPTPTLPDANLRYQDAPDWRKWTKGGWKFPFCPRSFEKAVMVAKW